MFTIFKNKESVLLEKTHKNILQATSTRNQNNKKIGTIGILTTEEVSSVFDIKRLVNEGLGISSIEMYSFINKQKESTNQYNNFSEKDFQKNGKITDAYFDSFLQKPFDLLITLLKDKNTYVSYAASISKANCKAGFATEYENPFDIEVKGTIESLDLFLSELKRYLIILEKIKK